MIDIWHVIGMAAVLLAALFVGLLIPVLASVRATSKEVRELLTSTRPRIEEVLRQTSQLLGTTNQIGSKSLPVANHLLTTLEEVTTSLAQLQRSARVASAIGASIAPAVAAAVRSLRESSEGHDAVRAEGSQADGGLLPAEEALASSRTGAARLRSSPEDAKRVGAREPHAAASS